MQRPEDTMPHPSPTINEVPQELRRIYKYSSIVWTVYATALALAIYGSTLLAFAQPARGVLGALATLVGIGMIVSRVVRSGRGGPCP
jgi:hypothetical protein